MSLGDFLTANSVKNTMVTLVNEGETEEFAIVSAGSATSLASDVTAKTVSSYTIVNNSKVTVVLSSL